MKRNIPVATDSVKFFVYTSITTKICIHVHKEILYGKKRAEETAVV
jgi:hypothetical protein